MPIYDFQCTDCGHQDEVMRKMSESSTTSCPKCKQETFSKMLAAPNFQLSGSGWYATDFKDSNKPKPEKKAEAAAPAKASSQSD